MKTAVTCRVVEAGGYFWTMIQVWINQSPEQFVVAKSKREQEADLEGQRRILPDEGSIWHRGRPTSEAWDRK